MLAALQNVRPSHLLDRRLWSALGVQDARDDEETPGRGGAAHRRAEARARLTLG